MPVTNLLWNFSKWQTKAIETFSPLWKLAAKSPYRIESVVVGCGEDDAGAYCVPASDLCFVQNVALQNVFIFLRRDTFHSMTWNENVCKQDVSVDGFFNPLKLVDHLASWWENWSVYRTYFLQIGRPMVNNLLVNNIRSDYSTLIGSHVNVKTVKLQAGLQCLRRTIRQYRIRWQKICLCCKSRWGLKVWNCNKSL
jgi:hypothetical protein